MTDSNCPWCGGKPSIIPGSWICCTSMVSRRQTDLCKLRCAEKRIAELEDALKPFANVLVAVQHWDDNAMIYSNRVVDRTIYVRDVRRAAKAMRVI